MRSIPRRNNGTAVHRRTKKTKICLQTVPILVTAFQRKLLIQNAARHCAYKYKHGSRGLNYWVKHTNETVLGDYPALALKRSTVQLWMVSGKLDPFP